MILGPNLSFNFNEARTSETLQSYKTETHLSMHTRIVFHFTYKNMIECYKYNVKYYDIIINGTLYNNFLSINELKFVVIMRICEFIIIFLINQQTLTKKYNILHSSYPR